MVYISLAAVANSATVPSICKGWQNGNTFILIWGDKGISGMQRLDEGIL